MFLKLSLNKTTSHLSENWGLIPLSKNTFFKKIPTFAGMCLLLCFPTPAFTQEYVPPPLFDSPQTVIKETAPAVSPAPIKAPTPTIKPTSKPKPLKKDQIPPPPSASRGVVKGSITMPSAPAKAVESETLFEPSEESASLFEAPPTQEEPKTESALSVKPDFIPPLPPFKTLSDGVLQSTLYFVSHTKTLSEANQKTITHLIVPELNKGEANKRILIQAYASPQENVLNGDRRIALSRALNIRKQLIESNIRANRIDVRAIGANTNTQPLDRVELIIR